MEEHEKQTTSEKILLLLREYSVVTKQDIATKLQLSMPTVLQTVHTMIQQCILQDCGFAHSTGGRKAQKLCLNPEIAYSIGIHLELNETVCVITNFLGDCIQQSIFPEVFRDDLQWYESLHQHIVHMTTQIPALKILSVGISFPGIISQDENWLLRSHIFGLETMDLYRFHHMFAYPVLVANDANCACVTQLQPQHDTYLYISLNQSVGGGIMLHGQLLCQEQFQAGEFGHMILVPNGKQCYCGKLGCADAYLSPNVLIGEYDTIDTFFEQVQKGNTECCEKMNRYLEYLAILTTNLRMAFHMDIIIGGEVGKRLFPYFTKLKKIASKYDRFARNLDYLYPCIPCDCAVGAAKLAIKKYQYLILGGKQI